MIVLYKPEPEDLLFRQKLVQDERTMSFNRRWGGTVPFPESAWDAWYDRWLVHHENRRFYRYLMNTETGSFVGEAAYRFDDERGIWLADIIVLDEFRGNGFGSEGLRLLCSAAGNNGIEVLRDDIAVGNPAVSMFLKAGFEEEYRNDGVIMLKKILRHRIIVIGCPGSGKSTFARKLRDRTGLPLYYLDRIFHNPDRTTVSNEVFDERLKEILAEDEWIIDGNYQRTLPQRFERCTEVYLFDLPSEQCLEGVTARIGRYREEMPWIENEFDPEFRQYILDFNHSMMPGIIRLTEQYRNSRKIIVFRSRDQADQYLNDYCR